MSDISAGEIFTPSCHAWWPAGTLLLPETFYKDKDATARLHESLDGSFNPSEQESMTLVFVADFLLTSVGFAIFIPSLKMETSMNQQTSAWNQQPELMLHRASGAKTCPPRRFKMEPCCCPGLVEMLPTISNLSQKMMDCLHKQEASKQYCTRNTRIKNHHSSFKRLHLSSDPSLLSLRLELRRFELRLEGLTKRAKLP